MKADSDLWHDRNGLARGTFELPWEVRPLAKDPTPEDMPPVEKTARNPERLRECRVEVSDDSGKTWTVISDGENPIRIVNYEGMEIEQLRKLCKERKIRIVPSNDHATLVKKLKAADAKS